MSIRHRFPYLKQYINLDIKIPFYINFFIVVNLMVADEQQAPEDSVFCDKTLNAERDLDF